jgi:hypothetical protein
MTENYDRNYKIEILNEIKAQFFYQCGLFLLKDFNFNDSNEDLILSNICFIISSLKSKPNQLKKSLKQVNSNKISDYLTEYTHLSSCFRYTVIGKL